MPAGMPTAALQAKLQLGHVGTAAVVDAKSETQVRIGFTQIGQIHQSHKMAPEVYLAASG